MWRCQVFLGYYLLHVQKSQALKRSKAKFLKSKLVWLQFLACSAKVEQSNHGMCTQALNQKLWNCRPWPFKLLRAWEFEVDQRRRRNHFLLKSVLCLALLYLGKLHTGLGVEGAFAHKPEQKRSRRLAILEKAEWNTLSMWGKKHQFWVKLSVPL